MTQEAATGGLDIVPGAAVEADDAAPVEADDAAVKAATTSEKGALEYIPARFPRS